MASRSKPARSHSFERFIPSSVVQLSLQLPQKMQASYRKVIFLVGGLVSTVSIWLRASVGQTFTQAPQPIHLSRSNSGLPLYLSGTTQGSAGNRLVNLGEKTAVTASFNSLNFGKRNFKLLPCIPYFVYRFYFLPFPFSSLSAYLSTTLFSHNGTPEA